MPRQVVVLGGFSHEGLIANAKAIGYEILPLALYNVTPKTWLRRSNIISKLFLQDNLAATIIYLHTSLLLQASKNEYRSAFLEIIEQAKKTKAIIFIFQDNLDGIYSMRHWETNEPLSLQELEQELKQDIERELKLARDLRQIKQETTLRLQEMLKQESYLDIEQPTDVVVPISLGDYRLRSAIRRLKEYESRKEEIDSLIKQIYISGVEVAPFYKRSDVTIRLQEFLNDTEQGVFLRLFVPNDRIQAEQLKSLLSVLERYLRQVEGQKFSIDLGKSDKGIIYLFRSESGIDNLQNLNNALSRFDLFMTMCGDQPEQALQVLAKQGFNDYDSAYIVEQYSKDYKRIILDTKHEFERKSLILKQRFENDLLDRSGNQVISLTKERVPSLIPSMVTGDNIAINIGHISIVNSQNTYNEIDKFLNGSIIYSENDKQLLELFSKYADGIESLQCRSDLDQLKDNTVTEPARQNAKQRLLSFLRKAAIKAGDITEKIAVGVLSKYIDSLLKGEI